MSVDLLTGRRRPQLPVAEPNIHSTFLLVTKELPPDIATDILSGNFLPDQVTHGYKEEVAGLRRFTRTRTNDDQISYVRREPFQGIYQDIFDAPFGTSADIEYKQEVSRRTFYRGYRDTAGRRIGKTRHEIAFEPEPGWEKVAQVDIFRGGIRGGVEHEEEIAGRMVVIVHFTDLEEAVAFNQDDFPGRPTWLGENVTKPLSTKKLIRQLNGENQLMAVEWLQQSASLDDLRERAL